MRFLAVTILLALSIVALAPDAFAEAPRAVNVRPERPSLHLICPSSCFEQFVVQKLSYFDFARDRFLADLTLVVVRQPSSGGGERFTVTGSWGERAEKRFAVRPRLVPQAFSLRPAATIDEGRTALVQAMMRLLYEAFARTKHAEAFQLDLPPRDGETLSALLDPWNYFVFVPELAAHGEAGSGYYYAEATAAATVRRVTERWRLRLRGAYTRNWNGFEVEDGSRVSSDIESWQARLISAHSVGKHFAVGGVGTGRGSYFENLAGHLHGGPALEFSLFPYEENAARQLRFVYQGGPWVNWYIEPNVAGALDEVRPYHAFSIIADINQAWGSIQWLGQINQFLDEPELFRLSTGVTTSLRVAKGLSLQIEGTAAIVEDQINLRGRPVTDEELLLWTVQQPTSFTFQMSLGLAYTFGSRHNTVVNPRFGRIDLDEE